MDRPKGLTPTPHDFLIPLTSWNAGGGTEAETRRPLIRRGRCLAPLPTALVYAPACRSIVSIARLTASQSVSVRAASSSAASSMC